MLAKLTDMLVGLPLENRNIKDLVNLIIYVDVIGQKLLEYTVGYGHQNSQADRIVEEQFQLISWRITLVINSLNESRI